ncbi:hypothetical protein [Fusobacterium hominis]|uniref:Uncharacterized protein n=1 Tax=Fusobacterium hominis TaxID=2764326 RepID=A0A7G9GXG8_9FUSO|nr:hypothetical protein [Fusobacterium hominis]QNM15500.1 hypothetical protein H9Q81_01275 [Fusobacterium hominis]
MYLITVYDTKTKKIKDETFKIVLDKITTTSLTSLKIYKKLFMKKFAGKDIVTRQRTSKGWIEINI